MKSRIAIKITLIYFVIGFLWILFSDQMIQSLSGSSDSLTRLQTLKGWYFVAVTAFLLFILIDREIRKKIAIASELLIAKEKAEESDRLKSAFLANMSHELRTPLNGIMGFCELILDDDFSKEDKQIFAQHMTKNGHDFVKLINDIIDISKLQENQFAIAKKRFNVNQMLEALKDEFEQSELRVHRNKLNFRLIKEKEEDQTELFSDPVKLAHILQNLLNNSFFFTNEGFVHFGYCKIGEGFEFFVEDSGSGIDNNNQELIFKPFFKGKDPVIGNKGFGLGLAISKGLVKLLGGELKFESTPHVGTRFYFTLSNEGISPGNQKKNDPGQAISSTSKVKFVISDIPLSHN